MSGNSDRFGYMLQAWGVGELPSVSSMRDMAEALRVLGQYRAADRTALVANAVQAAQDLITEDLVDVWRVMDRIETGDDMPSDLVEPCKKL